MLKLFFSFCLLFCIAISSIKAQDAAFIGRFEHQTETPVAYPNYFENRAWLTQMLETLKESVKKRYNINTLDYKKLGTVDFVPGFRTPGEMKMFSSTAYDLLISIVSQIETGLDNEKMGISEGSLLIVVEIWRPNDKRVFKSRAKAKFVVVPYQNDLAEVMMAEEDFQKMYEECLEAALQIKPKPKPFIFRQPAPQFYQDFLGKADKMILNQKDRVTFELNQNVNQVLKMNMQAPYQQEKQYGRSGSLQNPLAEADNIKLNSALFTNQTYNVQTQYLEGETVLGNFSMIETPELREIKGYFGTVSYTLSRGFLSGIAKIEIESKLVAILKPEANTFSDTKNLELYFAPQTSQAIKAKILTLLNVEILSEAVLKYYRLETGSGG
jgi:hypothetical protein